MRALGQRAGLIEQHRVDGSHPLQRQAVLYQDALAGRVAAGAKGITTGSSVASLTSSATCGRQGSAVAYHWPSRVVDCSPSRRVQTSGNELKITV